MLIREVMTESVVTAPPERTVREIAELMRERNVGSVVLVEDGKPVGFLTDRDLAVSVLAAGRAGSDSAREFASAPVITAEPDLANLRNAKNLIEAARTLRATDKPPLLVLNKLQMPRRPEISPRDFATAVDLEPASLIEFDAQLFGSAANNGLMIGEVSPKAKHAELFRVLAETLSGKAAPTERKSGLFKPLMHRLSRKLAS